MRYTGSKPVHWIPNRCATQLQASCQPVHTKRADQIEGCSCFEIQAATATQHTSRTAAAIIELMSAITGCSLEG
jgi:hypothetical protein